MVDLTLLQSISYIAVAAIVSIAAIYHIINLREQRLNRKIAFTSNLLQPIASKEAIKDWIILMNTKWSTPEDFKTKYDSTINEENFAARQMYFGTCQIIGAQYHRGLVDLETVYETAGEQIIDIFLKFKPIFDYYKKSGEYGRDSLWNFEDLAFKMAEMKSSKDPGYRGAFQYFGGPQVWEETFKKKPQ